MNADPLADFHSPGVDRVREAGGVWKLPAGRILLPRVFGFCGGVKRALALMSRALQHREGRRLVLLGEIIHNPWVNDYFRARGVRVLSNAQRRDIERHVGPEDVAVIPAFGVPLDVEQRLGAIGCEIIDAACVDVRRLWSWVTAAAGEGYGLLLFGKSRHDETVVTRSRLEAVGGSYVVAASLEQVDAFCQCIDTGGSLEETFAAEARNTDEIGAFERLAQASQTTMLYDHTLKVRERLSAAFAHRYGPDEGAERLKFQPTVCQATQQRQAAAVEACRRADRVVVVGGFGSSNTRHLHELASQYAPAVHIESAEAIRSEKLVRSRRLDDEEAHEVRGWLGEKRPVTVAVLAGASSPEVVVGEVMQRIAGFLGDR